MSTPKSYPLSKFLDTFHQEVFGKTAQKGQCVSCGAKVNIEDFRDDLSIREYSISHFCQKCQDDVFGVPK